MALDIKKLMLFIGTMLVSFSSVAATSGFGKNSSQLSNLGSAWKSYHTIQPTLDKNDIEMGYGGQDIVHAPIIAMSTGTA